MRQVFDWADVSVSAAFLSAIKMCKKKTQQDVINELAATAGVCVQWDISGRPKLSGSWTKILQTHVIFIQYLSKQENTNFCSNINSKTRLSLLAVDSTESERKPEMTKKSDIHNLATRDEELIFDQRPDDNNIVNQMEENEVYVNITVSMPSFGEVLLHKKNIAPHETCATEQQMCVKQVPKNDNMSIKTVVRNETKSGEKQHCHKSDSLKIILSERQEEVIMKKKECQAEINNGTLLKKENEMEHINTKVKGYKDNKSPEVNILCPKETKANKIDLEKDKVGSCNQISKTHSNIIMTAAEKICSSKRSQFSGNKKCVDKQRKTEGVSSRERKLDDPIFENEKSLQVVSPKPKVLKGEVLPSDREQHYCMKQKEEPQTVDLTKKKLKRKNYEALAPFKFFCSQCSFKSKRESHFRRHLQLHSQVSHIFECEKCNFKTIRLGNLRRHELSHSDAELYCDLCTYRTMHPKLLIRHQRNKHSSRVPHSEEKEILQCSHCNYSTTRAYFLQRHSKVHDCESLKDMAIFECSECPYKANRKEHLARHASNVHGCHRPFLCHHCGKAFKRHDALKQHSATHLSHPPLRCPVCNKGCRSRAHLTQHSSVHSNRRLFLCELCGASFKTRAVQRKHILTIHHHPKAFSCLHCSRKFNTKYTLRRHMKQHFEKNIKVVNEVAPVNSAPVPVHIIHPETIIIDANTRNQIANKPTMTVQEHVLQRNEEKLPVHDENYGAESVRVIPAHAFVQHSNETATALLYLTGNFTSY